jgi:hypothetical protein
MEIDQKITANDAAHRDSAWAEAEASGIDMTLIEQTLRLTVWERLVEHQRALERVRIFQNARIKPNG